VVAVACVFLAGHTNPVALMLQCCVCLSSHMRKQLCLGLCLQVV